MTSEQRRRARRSHGHRLERIHNEQGGHRDGASTDGTLSFVATRIFSPEIAPGLVEFAGTATSLWSVWITQRRNVLALPVGIISVALMGLFFLEIGLIGQTR